MNRKNESKYQETLSETVERLVEEAGGWLSVIGRMTSTFDHAISSLGRNVDCPFPERHGNGQGKGDFRFSERRDYEGRAICTCMQDRGMSPVELLMLDGIGGGGWVGCMRAIYLSLSKGNFVRKDKKRPPIPESVARAEMSEDQLKERKQKLALIARGTLPMHHPDAHPARRYFANRGINWNRNMEDVRFHPSLPYWEEVEGKFKLVGNYPTIVSAFRDENGRVVNLHRIFITQEGHKAPVSKVKKACSGLPGFRASGIKVASGVRNRTLHVTEGVEKGWAIHLAFGDDVLVSYSCSTLPALPINKSEYDHIVIWSDNDPANPNRERETGDGQYFAWKLARRLHKQGFGVAFMMPSTDNQSVKGRDWEDVIVEEGVLSMPNAQERLKYLQSKAVRGGVFMRTHKVA